MKSQAGSAKMDRFSETSILVLCGGLGKRLRSVVSDRPKALADVLGRPFITFVLDQISKAGGEEVVLCTGYKGHELERSLGDRYKTLSLRYSKETESLGTAGALRNAYQMMRFETAMVFNGDSYCDIQPQNLLECHLSKKALSTLLLVRAPDTSRYGCVRFDSDYWVTSFEEKKTGKSGGWINAGIYCINRECIASMQEKRKMSLEKDFFPAMIGRGLFACPQEVSFIDIGTPASYGEAEVFFKKVKGFSERGRQGEK